MAAYRRVYDSRHLQADCQEPGSALANRVWATFTFIVLVFMFLMIRQLLRPYLSTKSGGEFVGFARSDRCSTEWCGVCS